MSIQLAQLFGASKWNPVWYRRTANCNSSIFDLRHFLPFHEIEFLVFILLKKAEKNTIKKLVCENNRKLLITLKWIVTSVGSFILRWISLVAFSLHFDYVMAWYLAQKKWMCVGVVLIVMWEGVFNGNDWIWESAANRKLLLSVKSWGERESFGRLNNKIRARNWDGEKERKSRRESERDQKNFLFYFNRLDVDKIHFNQMDIRFCDVGKCGHSTERDTLTDCWRCKMPWRFESFVFLWISHDVSEDRMCVTLNILMRDYSYLCRRILAKCKIDQRSQQETAGNDANSSIMYSICWWFLPHRMSINQRTHTHTKKWKENINWKLCLRLSIAQVNICKRKLIAVKRRRKKYSDVVDENDSDGYLRIERSHMTHVWKRRHSESHYNFCLIRWKLSQHYCGKRSKFGFGFFSFAHVLWQPSTFLF